MLDFRSPSNDFAEATHLLAICALSARAAQEGVSGAGTVANGTRILREVQTRERHLHSFIKSDVAVSSKGNALLALLQANPSEDLNKLSRDPALSRIGRLLRGASLQQAWDVFENDDLFDTRRR
ncbi:MAG: hypothetical protein H6729_10320 [Deltaproteobacteria bacterium]|nr:hypothetical protein [Deltaproteobacteria bacterium]